MAMKLPSLFLLYAFGGQECPPHTGCGAPRPLAHELSGFVALAPCRTVRSWIQHGRELQARDASFGRRCNDFWSGCY